MDLGSPCPWTSGHNERWDILDFGFGQLIGPRQLKVWHLGIFRFAFGPFRKPGSTLVAPDYGIQRKLHSGTSGITNRLQQCGMKNRTSQSPGKQNSDGNKMLRGMKIHTAQQALKFACPIVMNKQAPYIFIQSLKPQQRYDSGQRRRKQANH